ncbi:MAG: hypothetical protein DMG13_14925 [Acidobacteria bacterium]|nr:MAG: hypothetical protein DMG13_14925 [Acidobacteriota bacterium]
MEWQEFDVATLVTRIADLHRQIEKEKAGNARLAALDAQITNQQERYNAALVNATGPEASLTISGKRSTVSRMPLKSGVLNWPRSH